MAPSSKRQEDRKDHLRVLVDLDNIAFREGVFDARCAADRMRAVFAVSKHVESFCNAKTRDLLGAKSKSIAKFAGVMHVSEKITKDSADHLMIARYLEVMREKKSATLVVTHDKNLARMVHYFTPPSAIRSLRYGLFGKASSSCENLDLHHADRFALSFNDRRDLDVFLDSLSRFRNVATSIVSE